MLVRFVAFVVRCGVGFTHCVSCSKCLRYEPTEALNKINPMKVLPDRRPWRMFLNSDMKNIFHFLFKAPIVYGNGLAATGDFHFRDLEVTP